MLDDVYLQTPVNNLGTIEDYSKEYIKKCLGYGKTVKNLNTIPGRALTKLRLHRTLDESFFGTKELIQKDIDIFVEMITSPSTQEHLEAYLSLLSSRKG